VTSTSKHPIVRRLPLSYRIGMAKQCTIAVAVLAGITIAFIARQFVSRS
jgi:hypothetical protein